MVLDKDNIWFISQSDFLKGSAKMDKTLWQKIYSFFGLWSYYETSNKGKYEVFYWCCLPWGKFFRKFDLFKIKC